jgi:tRNA(fMet)-specific endonuclease VapC
MTRLLLDNSFLSDYIAGEAYTQEFLSQFPPTTDVLVPTIVSFEALVPAYRSGSGRTISQTVQTLNKFTIVDFDTSAAEEAAQARAELLDRGRPVGPPDILIAGTALANDAEVVTLNSSDFDPVSDLTVHDPS